MRLVKPAEQAEQLAFAKKAAEMMAAKPWIYTSSEGDPEPGKLLAVRWNRFTVLVLKLAEDHEPALYPTDSALMIGADLPPLKGEA